MMSNNSSLDLSSILDLEPDFGFDFSSNPSIDLINHVDQADSANILFDQADSVHLLSVSEQRKLRRKISNRESARRSRARKQRHLEEIRVKLAKLKSENQNLSSRLKSVSNRYKLVQYQNLQLTNESVMLRQRLMQARRVLVLRQIQKLVTLPRNGFVSGSGYESGSGFGLEQALASLIS